MAFHAENDVARTHLRQGRIGFVAGLLLLAATAVSADGRIESIATQGDAAADGNGQQWLFYDSPVVSDSGAVAYTVWHSFTNTSAEIYGVNLWDAGSLHQLARGGELSPDSNGEFSRFQTPSINALDQVAFYTQFTNTASGTSDDRGIAIADTLGVNLILREGQSGPNSLGTVNYFNDQDEEQPLGLDIAGRVVATSNLLGIPGTTANITRGDGINPIEAIVADGDLIPGGGATFGSFFLEGLTTGGDILYKSFLNGAPNGTSSMLVLDTFTDRLVIARTGHAAADGNGDINNLTHAGVGDGEHVALVAQYRNTAGGSGDDFAVTRHHASGDHLIFREGDAAPSGNGTFRGGASRIGKPWVTEQGVVALNVDYTGTNNGSNDNHGIVRFKQFDTWAPQLIELVREGDPAPDGDGEFSTISDIRSMNDAGVVLFEGRLRNSVSAGTSTGIYLTDGFETLRVALTGGEFGLAPDSLNELGQVAYRSGGSASGGAHQINLFTPDLYWRHFSGHSTTWDARGNPNDTNTGHALDTNQSARLNFTLSLKPGHVHNIIFDTSRFVGGWGASFTQARVRDTVDDTVRSITLRSGTGISMEGGKLTALEGFDLVENSQFRGYGELHGDVFIGPNSKVESDNLNIYGNVTIDTDGELRMEDFAGSGIHFTEIHGTVENNGQTAVVQNIFGGAPMVAEFHGDFINNGRLQISRTFGSNPQNDRAEIFGDYFGPGEIANHGTLVFHGGFFPGASPVRHEYEGAGTMELGTTAHTIMEIAGLTAGSGHNDPAAEYDSIHLIDGGTLVLGGTLEIDLIAVDGETQAFAPALGDLFTLFTAGQILGDFDSPLVLPQLAEGLRWQVLRDTGSYAVGVSAVPLPAGVWFLISGMLALHFQRTSRKD